MFCAPIIIPTLNRYDHLVRCIESLKRNSLAQETELYISLDYPPSDKYAEGYKRVKYYLENELTDGFKQIYKYYQGKNLGPSDNAKFLYAHVFEKYDRYIITEDDNEFAPNFLEYINRGLELYEDDDTVLAICGYRDEKTWDYDGGNAIKLQRFYAWGYASWKRKMDLCRQWVCRDNFMKLIRNKSFCQKLWNTRYKSYYTFVESLLVEPNDLSSPYVERNGEIRCIDYTISIYMIAFQMYAVSPQISKVRNWGYDGTGVNCGRDDKINPEQVKLDEKESFHYAISETAGKSKHNLDLNRDEEFKYLAKKARLYVILIRCFGVKSGRKIRNMIYRINKFKTRFQKSRSKG